jgi:ribosome-binding protein aMBF1 (putative translation factor)
MDSLKSMIAIAKLRKDGWDWIRMAKKLNVSEQTIRNWATGKNTPHPNNLIALKRLENGTKDSSSQESESDRVED